MMPYQIVKVSPLVLLGFLIISCFCITENIKAQSVNFNRIIATSSDDAEENISATTVDLNSTDLEVVIGWMFVLLR
ncbi:MAG: hypothetical protein IPN49_16510 [Saprospiraceae bacterium]|nr:hypothetical protein [Saprospiraceae bacterium]